MMDRQALAQCAQADIRTCDPRALTDLRNVTVDTSLPPARRLAQLLEQVHNPYLFQVDGVAVKVRYGGSRRLSAALAELLENPDP